MRLLARAGLVDDALDFQPQRPRQCLRLLFCLLLALDEKDRGGANHLAGVITLGEVATSPLLLSSIFRRTDTPTSCKFALSERFPVLAVRLRASNSEREPTVKECADQDGRREHDTGDPELGCPRQRRNLDLRSRPTVGAVSREKLDESVGNFSCLIQWSEETG